MRNLNLLRDIYILLLLYDIIQLICWVVFDPISILIFKKKLLFIWMYHKCFGRSKFRLVHTIIIFVSVFRSRVKLIIWRLNTFNNDLTVLWSFSVVFGSELRLLLNRCWIINSSLPNKSQLLLLYSLSYYFVKVSIEI